MARFYLSQVISLLLMSASLSIEASPRAVPSSGEYVFGPDLSQTEACRRAEDRAKASALRKVYGESLFSQSLIDCDDNRGDDCLYTRTTISHLNGLLFALEDRREQVWDQGPLRVCRVSGVARVDPNSTSGRLYFRASLNKTVFRSGDEVLLTFDFPIRSHLAIFSHTDPRSDRFMRIYPNRHDQGLAVEGKLVVPSVGSRYKFMATIEKRSHESLGRKTDTEVGYRSSSSEWNVLTEYLYLIATEEQVTWLEQYSAAELQSHLSSISPSKRFVRVLSYRIMQ